MKEDGQIYATDGSSLVKLFADCGEYFVAIAHRNHLPIQTANTFTLSTATNEIDFCTTAIYGTNAVTTQNGVQLLWAGDADGDRSINASDRSTTWNRRNQNGYLGEDVDLDGVVTAADRSIVWNNRNRASQ